MGEVTGISWTDHTFNAWIGCSKVHAGCTNCYAESDFDKRRHFAKWGPNGTRIVTSDAYWKKPLAWSKQAQAEGVRHRVFCSSLADVFEEWGSNYMLSSRKETDEACAENGFHKSKWSPVLWHRDDIGVCTAGQTTVDHSRGDRTATMNDVLRDLFKLIDSTPWLDWQLLTKRPENIRRKWQYKLGEYRRNVWLGTSVSDQATADKAIYELLQCRDLSPVLFLSCEPLLGPIDLCHVQYDNFMEFNALTGDHGLIRPHAGRSDKKVDWVIVGGESGPNARPNDISWTESIIEQCKAAGVACFHKQLGSRSARVVNEATRHLMIQDPKGGDMSEWPESLRVRQFPTV